MNRHSPSCPRPVPHRVFGSRSGLPATALLAALATLAAGCAVAPPGAVATMPITPAVREALAPPAGAAHPPAAPESAANPALNPTLIPTPAPEDALAQIAPPAPPGKKERRFSLTVTDSSPGVLFMALLDGTPLSVALDPGVKGPLSINLKDVTLREALDLLRELHNLEYKVIGRHILVAPAQMQTRMFRISYPSFNRSGRSELRVVSGSITGGGGGSGNGNNNGNNGGSNTNNGSGSAGVGANGTPTSSTSGGSSPSGTESSRITTSQHNDLWAEIESTIRLLIGDKDGRNVVMSPQSGTLIVRALPREMREVSAYLDATRASVERQVMLEAKIVEVQLTDGERSGINWAAFKAGLSTRASVGVIAPGGSLSPTGSIAGGLIDVVPGVALDSAASTAGSLLGLAFQTNNFAAVLEFLGTQGNTQVLSSPRIATMNNQKALLKVGTDDFFVTNISTTTTAVGNTTASTPNISVQPFFSGISLDVTPDINDQGFITLHIHPAVSTVTERSKILNLGTQGTYSLPLASSDINETDAVVRARDGNIIAIGGLMRQSTVHTDSGIPGTEGTVVRKLLGGQSTRLTEKRELVILLKPTIIDPNKEDAEGRQDALQRLLDWTDGQPVLAR